MKKRNIIIVLVIAVCFFMTTLPATAGLWTTGVTNKKVLVGANAAQLYSTNTTGSPVYHVYEGEAGALKTGGFVTLKLTGGAVFTSTSMGNPTVASGTSGIPTVGTLAFADGGTAGYSYAKFVVTGSDIPSGAKITFNTATTSCLNVAAVVNNVNVDANVSILNSSNTLFTTERSLNTDIAGYLFTGQNLFTIANGNNAVTSDYADVLATSGPFTKFINNTLTGTGTTLTSTTPTIGAASVPATAINKKKILVTLSGDFNGISKITNTDFTGCDSTGNPTGTLGLFSISADKTKAYAVYNQDYTGAAGLTISPKFYIDGTTTQAVRAFTAQFENLDDPPNYVATVWQTAQTNYKILRNGVSFSANSLGPLNTVKITDKSGNVTTGGAKVIITAYDTDGAKLAEVAGAPVLLVQNFATLQLTGDVIAARFTGTPMLYEFAVASTNAIITNVKKTAEGFGSTVYTNTNNDVGGGI